jgi:beta-glucosidase
LRSPLNAIEHYRRLHLVCELLMAEVLQFPPSFVFGAATAAYQIEGAWDEEGKGPSIWDVFTHTPGRISDRSTGDVASDHVHRMAEDVRLIRELGMGAYRFSVSWPRVVPDGRGASNAAGIAFYDRLVDALLQASVTPYITLFHWDLPAALQKQLSGFTNRECAHHFADFAQRVALALGDRVSHFITLNEPQIFTMMGHAAGVHAPGLRRPWLYLKVLHNLMLAHGLAAQAVKSARPEAKVGITLNLMPVHPREDIPADRLAAELGDALFNKVCLDPLFRGRYPDRLLHLLGRFSPDVRAGDMETIGTQLDFLGINNYSRIRAYHAWWVPFLKMWFSGMDIAEEEYELDGVPYTAIGWEVYPEAIYQVLTRDPADYGHLPMYVTENGAAFEDRVEEGAVHDRKRVAFLQAYLGKVQQAIQAGANVRGYFVWSLLDTFEWSVGKSKRFGLIHVDYRTQQRIIKDSGLWYRDLIKAQAH